LNPARSRVTSFFDELSIDIVHQRGEHSVTGPMLPMMNAFEVQPSPPKADGGSSYYEFSSSMRRRKAVAINSETSFDDEASQETNHVRNVSGNQIRLTQCKQNSCSVLTDRDEAYACWHPKVVGHLQKEQHAKYTEEVHQHHVSVRELESSISAGGACNRAQRFVSFAESPAERTSMGQQFAVYRHSTSLSDPIIPSPLISPRLRGLSFSKKFEEHMLTLPMPLVEHSVPFAGRRSSTVSATPSDSRSITTLSSKKSQ
jgi:hypothetical protein